MLDLDNNPFNYKLNTIKDFDLQVELYGPFCYTLINLKSSHSTMNVIVNDDKIIVLEVS